jgi:hypothetical protein
MSMNTLYEIAGSDQGWAAQRAAMAIAMTEQFQGGGLDRSEYEEMIRDLVRLDTLDREANDLALKTALVSAIYAVAQVA